MTHLRVLTCDDERLALERLNRMLQEYDDVDIVASCQDPIAAAEALAALRPDVAFMDIEMPVVNGFEVLKELSAAGYSPFVVFVTAHSNFAPKAFETGALDFLPKPFRQERLDAAVARARTALSNRAASARMGELEKALDRYRNENAAVSEPSYAWVTNRGGKVRINLELVDFIAAEGEYVRLHIGETSFLHRELLGSIEGRLDRSRFLRIHRSIIVRLDLVAGVRRSVNGGTIVRLATGKEFSVGRKYSKNTRRTLHPID